VTLRPLTRAALPAIAEILAEPGAARWWGRYDVARLEREYFEDDSRERAFVIELDAGDPPRLAQYREEAEPEYRHAGMDIAIAAEQRGRGVGLDALRTLGRHLIDERGHWRLTIDPDSENARAIRAFEKLGFRPVGVMRRYERRPDGTFRDALLMDVLAEELSGASAAERGG